MLLMLINKGVTYYDYSPSSSLTSILLKPFTKWDSAHYLNIGIMIIILFVLSSS